MPKRRLFHLKAYRKPHVGGGTRLKLNKRTGIGNSINRYSVVYRGRAPSDPAKASTDVYLQETSNGHDATVTKGKPEETPPTHYNLKPGQSLKGRGEEDPSEDEDDKMIQERLAHPEISTGLLYDSDEEQPSSSRAAPIQQMEESSQEEKMTPNQSRADKRPKGERKIQSNSRGMSQSGSGNVQERVKQEKTVKKETKTDQESFGFRFD